ncbi:SRPBCC family protein [Mycobacterium sp.]|uniref:SRPBCC family protein n=1 Tax=Mycobacterium sp. TaxID=1785 RepID=UPI003D0F2196
MKISTHRRGASHTQTGSIDIAAPPDTVWDLITTTATIHEWYDTWDTVEHDTNHPRLKLGSSFRLRSHRRGRDATAECTVTELTAPTRLQWRQDAPHTPTTMVTFELTADATSATRILHTRTWSAPWTAAQAPAPHRQGAPRTPHEPRTEDEELRTK